MVFRTLRGEGRSKHRTCWSILQAAVIGLLMGGELTLPIMQHKLHAAEAKGEPAEKPGLSKEDQKEVDDILQLLKDGETAMQKPDFTDYEDVVNAMIGLKTKSGKLVESGKWIVDELNDDAFKRGQVFADLEKASDWQAKTDEEFAKCLALDVVIQKQWETLHSSLHRLETSVGNLECALKQIRCELRQLNCALATLPCLIRRAKIRAFIKGFIVGFIFGMGVGAMIGGGGAAVGVAGSAPFFCIIDDVDLLLGRIRRGVPYLKREYAGY